MPNSDAGVNIVFDVQTGEPSYTSGDWQGRVVYAGFFPRLAAFVLDMLLAGGLALSLTLPLRFVSFANTAFLFDYSLLDVAKFLLIAVYFVLFTHFFGSTPGKLLLRLRVISLRSAGGKVSFFDALYRETVGRFISSLLCIGYIVVAFDSRHRGFHDMLCDTAVIYR